MIYYKPKHILTWMMLLFLLGHVVVAHKEFRFLFPLAFFYPFFTVISLEYLGGISSKWNQQKWFAISKNVLWKSFWVANAIAILVMITKPSDSTIAPVSYTHLDVYKRQVSKFLLMYFIASE